MHAVDIEHPKTDAIPLVLDSPHSGRDYPDDFVTQVERESLVRLEDGYVDELIDGAPRVGATVIKALFPRSYIDPNRSETDLDTRMLDGRWPYPTSPTHKSDLGVGLVFNRSLDGRDFYAEKLTAAAVLHRIENYYRPYHDGLRDTLNSLHSKFGLVWHLNCHSMPAFAASAAKQSQPRPDICLGNRHGTTASAELVDLLSTSLRQLGLNVTCNDPYAGVELVRRYSNPRQGAHSVQVEINRALYMNESTHTIHSGFAPLKRALETVFGKLAQELRRDLAQAAE